MKYPLSEKLYNESKKYTPKGVSSPVRAFEPFPLFMSKGDGCLIWDVDGNEYIDLCMAYGPLMAGHANKKILDAVNEQLLNGSVFGTPSKPELALLRTLCNRIPCAESVRLTNSGTEATMHAVRLARGYTGKKDIVKITGGFHGSHDSVLVRGDVDMARCTPSSAGIPINTASNTFTIEYNDADALDRLLQKEEGIAAVIMEPILGNVGVVPPKKGYLEEMRRITSEHSVLLIFDEVITGFRVAPDCAQGLFGVTPDLCTLGKIIGGGFPIGAIAGKREIMDFLSPSGPVYQAGTFSGNPISAAGGNAMLGMLSDRRVYSDLRKRTDILTSSFRDSLCDHRVKGCVQEACSMFQVFFGMDSVNNGTDAMKTDRAIFEKMFRHMLESGIYLPPSALETNFISTEHDDLSIRRITETFDKFLGGLSR